MLRLLRKAFGPLLLTVVIAAVATILLARNAGWESMVVTTGSMSPTYPAGSLVAAAPPTGDEQVGDVIVFRHPDARDVRVTHRITAVEPDGYATMGDANEDPDPWIVPTDDVLGVIRGGLPGVGLAMTRFRTGPWPWLLASGILAAEAIHQFRKRDDDEEETEREGAPASPKLVAGLSVFALVSGTAGTLGTTKAVFSDHAEFGVTSTSGCWDIDDDTTADEDESVDDDTLEGEDDTSCDDDTSVDVDEDSSSDDDEDGAGKTETQRVQGASSEAEGATPRPAEDEEQPASPEPTAGEEPEPAEGTEEQEGETATPEPDPEPAPGESPDDEGAETDEDENVPAEGPEGEPEPAPSGSGEQG